MPLSSTSGAKVANFESGELRIAVASLLKEHVKDQKLVEMETIEAVITKISNWGKLFGFFVGIPLALFALILGFLGASTYSDFSKVREQALNLRRDSEELFKNYESLKTRGQQLKSQFAALEKVPEEITRLTKRVESVSSDVNRQVQISKLLTAIDGLDSSKAISLATNPPVQIQGTKTGQAVALRFPTESYKKDAAAAKAMLKMVLTLIDRTDANLDAWKAAVY